ncbi:hypothetical protein TVAGG3_0858350 [Trichomonas vaginalis G3]|uniref:hypothetical protein n=1 Tax=Trichomonas vaginalis (strain ATCC PRA-98 / G3) TaxID=412133 RepID=UPI0021E5641C|nr:hypothetical protein TVAGG3_0858350 [Trichomonas vaginalis G3]KAI5500491.1 hypothetical protein TVAGG3_0858350 [Trichomonas vaginalis G3]
MGVAGVYHFRVKKTFEYDFTNERDSPILDDYTTSEMITDEEDRTLDVLHALKDVIVVHEEQFANAYCLMFITES